MTEQNKTQELMILKEHKLRVHSIVKQIALLEKSKKDLLEKAKIEMEQKGIKKYDDDVISITYIDAMERKGNIDIKKLEADNINVDTYRKAPIKVNSSIKIKVKEI